VRNLLSLSLVAGLLSFSVAQSADWTQFRGPNGTGTVEETKLPDQWSASKNVAWKAGVNGYGWSSPIIVGDKVYLTSASTKDQKKPSSGGFGGGGGGMRPPGGGGGFRPGGGSAPNVNYKFEVVCLDLKDGKVVWSEVAADQKPTIPTHSTNTYASETPVSDGERIYAYFGMTGVFCYDLKGKQLWKKDLGSYSMAQGWGTGSSPVLDDKCIFIQCDNEQKSFLIALDKKTGDEVWKVSRSDRSSWATPYVWKTKDRTELVTVGSSSIRSYDPANGKVLWEIKGIGTQGGRPAAAAVGDDERVYVGMGGGMGSSGPIYAVKAGAKGELSSSSDSMAWSSRSGGPSTSTPILYKGYLYIVDGRGSVTCYEARSGKQSYKERLTGARSFTSSPWACNDKIYFLDDNGQTFVVKAGTEFKLLETNNIGEMCWSSPALTGDALLLRSVDRLYCIKGEKK